MSSYDHVEAEIGDNVAFFSHGHLVTYGSVYGVRSKFGQLLNFVIWPGANFTKHQRALIEKLLIQELPVDLPRPTWEMMGNESIRFCIAFSATVPVHRIIEQMENNREELGIKYLEVQRQNLYDAYYKWVLIRKETYPHVFQLHSSVGAEGRAGVEGPADPVETAV